MSNANLTGKTSQVRNAMDDSYDKSIIDVFSSQNNGLFKVSFMSRMSRIRTVLYKAQGRGRNNLEEKRGDKDTPN